jgi:hypothetical protein
LDSAFLSASRKSDSCEDLFLLVVHIFFFFLGDLVVIAEQMERGMYGEEGKLALDAVTVFLCLRLRFFGGNDDIAERNGVTVVSTAVVKLLSFPHREGKNVRGLILISVLAVQLMDLFVVDKGDGNLRGLGKRFILQHLTDRLDDSLIDICGKLHFSLLIAVIDL